MASVEKEDVRSGTEAEHVPDQVLTEDATTSGTAEPTTYSAMLEGPAIIDVAPEPPSATEHAGGHGPPADRLSSDDEPDRVWNRPGFAGLSDFMAQDPDLQIYRRFDNLASKALLYQESELQYLQDELNKLENDEEKNDALPDYRSVKWTVLESTSLDPQSLGHEQAIRRVTLVRRLQMAMKDYQEALIRQSQLLNLQAPNTRAGRTLAQGFLDVNHNTQDDIRHLLPGGMYRNERATTKRAERELVALRTSPNQDPLTEFLEGTFAPLLRENTWTVSTGFRWTAPTTWFRTWTNRPTRARTSSTLRKSAVDKGNIDGKSRIYFYEESTLAFIVSGISAIIAYALLIGAVFALNYTKGNPQRLGLIAGLTLLFAITFGFLTNATRTEVYGATAAYVAVLVVFISQSESM